MRVCLRFGRLLTVVLASVTGLAAQAVISAHAGILNFSEGSLLVDDQPLNPKFGTFPEIKQGSTLRTAEDARAEILLTPGVFLRIDGNSGVRMLSTSLADARVEILNGSAIIDTNNAPKDAPVTIVFRNYQVRFPKPGVYRIDSDPGVFETYTGQAEIRADGESARNIDESNQFFFSIGAETKKYGDGAVDNFSEWCRNRAEALNADQQAANQTAPDPADPGSSPFGGVVPSLPSTTVPSYGFPGGGSVGVAPLVVDNGFFGSYGPPYNQPFYANPLVIFWVYPRNAINGRHYGTPPLKTGYPSLPPSRVTYPHPAPWRPTPIPLAHAPSYYRPPVTRSYSPPVRSAPVFHPAAPAGGIAVHHR